LCTLLISFLSAGDRPFLCKFCGKKFALACNLRAHTKTHHHSDEKSDSIRETSAEQTAVTTTYDNTQPRHEDKPGLTSPTGINDTNYNIHSSWHEKNNKETQSIVVTGANKCTLPTTEMIQQFSPCSLIKKFHSADSTASPLNVSSATNITDHNKSLFHMNSSNCILDNVCKSATDSSISRLAYASILEDLWSGNNSFVNQRNIPMSVVTAPFNINMPCITSISLGDLQALLLMQAANMAMIHGGNISFGDGKSLKKHMTEPTQNRSLLLA
jgi:hypothetical protein